MIEERINVKGNVGLDTVKIYPVTQEKKVVPTTETQEILPDDKFYALSKIIVNPIPDEYIIPTGEIEITENGTIDVANKSSANVNVKTEIDEYMGNTATYVYNMLTCGPWIKTIKKLKEPFIIEGSIGDRIFWGYTGETLPKLDTSKIISMENTFYSCKALTTIPELDTSNVTNMSSMFSYCEALTTIPELDTSNVTNMSSMFSNCEALTTIPELDTSNVTNMSSMFSNCKALTTIPELDTSNVTNMSSMFSYCEKLELSKITIPNHKVSCDSLFMYCASLKKVPQINGIENITTASNMFWGCIGLTTITNELDNSKFTNFRHMFYNCKNLVTLQKLDASNATNMFNVLYYCDALENFGGFENVGQSYLTSTAANDLNYKVYCYNSTKLTHDSLMNIINGLYDIKTKGCNQQTLYLGSANIAKLSSEEIQIATDKGWAVS